MGFLDNDSVIVDAILTKHGRRKLAEGQTLGITQFALSDDGVDYTAWNVNHPSGSANYGEAIENMPLIEVVPDDSTLMKYKLNDLPRNTRYFPRLINVIDSHTIATQTEMVTIRPGTDNWSQASEKYKFTSTDTSIANFSGATRKDIGYTKNQYPYTLGIRQAAEFHGDSLVIKAKPTKTQKTLTILIEGLSSGAVSQTTIQINANVTSL
jgi:hypothetical protein